MLKITEGRDKNDLNRNPSSLAIGFTEKGTESHFLSFPIIIYSSTILVLCGCYFNGESNDAAGCIYVHELC